MKKRILALLLTLVMLVGMMPVNAFATETELTNVEPCTVTEGCTFTAGHEGNCSNYVAPTEACDTEGCTYGVGHEGKCSNYVAPTACDTDGCTYTYGHDGDCSPVVDQSAAQNVINLISAIGEVTLDSEVAIKAADDAYNALTDAQKALVTNYDVLTEAKDSYMALSVPAPAADPAEDAVVYVSGAKNGTLFLVNQPVTVTDRNADGLLSYDEALTAAHEAYCPGGYVSIEGSYGLQVGKLWGEGDGTFANALFYNNDKALQMNVGEGYVSGGDRLYACMLKYSDGWNDAYAYFDRTAVTVSAGEEFTLTLNGSSYSGSAIAYDQVKVGTWSNGVFTALAEKTFDESGNITLSFNQVGSYIVSAEGEYYDDYGGLTPIMPPYCMVTVEKAEEPAVGLAVLKFASSSSATATPYTMTPAFDPAVREYTIVVPDATASVYAWATLNEDEDASSAINVVYTNTSGTEKTVALTSGKASGHSLASTVKSGALTGNTLKVTVGDDTEYTITIVRQATLQRIGVTAVNGDTSTVLTLSPSFNYAKTEYTADAPHTATTLKLTPTVKSTGATVTINGASDTEVAINWADDLTAKYVFVVSGEGAESSTYTLTLSQLAASIAITTPPTKTTYDVGDTFDATGMVVTATYSNGTTETIEKGTYTYEPTGALSQNTTAISISFDSHTVEQAITMNSAFKGDGTQEKPFEIWTQADLVKLSELVAAGVSFSGEYLKMMADITLPTDWTPLGVSASAPFSGNFDGDNHLLTVSEGGLPLIGTPKGASLSKLNIYGSKIAGYGVVNNYCEIGKNHAITIENVTLKSGTQTLQAGFIGGYASGSDTVTIRNCTVEKNVVIGYDKAQKWIGSFAGEFNGTIENCVSYATVYGTDFVGGIVSNKGQSMGTFTVSNCQFYGDVIATGNYVGGIVGHGYGGTKWGFSSNAGIPTITNCTATGSVTGANYVGGIYGGDAGVVQVWDNATGSVTNNTFTGTVTATATDNQYVGAIIGYLKSLNKNNVIENNAYIADCGATKGIGYVQYVDTSCETHETESGATYVNTANGKPGITGMTKTNLNRTDDPLGADAEKLCYALIAVESITLDKNEAVVSVGDTVTLTATVLPEDAADKTVTWASSDESVATIADGVVTAKAAGTATITVKAGEQEATCTVTVTAESNPGGTIQVGSAEELPSEIPEGTVCELTADITLTNGQQISNLAGVLDGKGHTITLADKPLATEVSGTIQNLGVLSSGTLSLSGYSGSMAVTLSGTIQNCYSLANLTTSGWDDIGGLVGTLSGGKIYNSYYAGTNSAMFADGLVGMGGDNSEIANSLYTAGYSAIGMNGSKVTQTNVVKKTAAEMKESNAVTALNTDIKDTGFQWAMDTANTNNGFPVLKVISSSDPVDKTALAAKIDEVEALDENLYTEATWTAVETALAAAKEVNDNEAATQSQVNTALSDLEEAVNGLEKKKPLEPVAPPTDTDTIVHITSQADLAAITPSDATKHYVLDNDITLSGGYDGWWSFDTFQGVLDGQGHTITFNGTKSGLFYNIGKNGVVQNVHFTGSIDADHGACGLEIQGAVINCYTEVTGSNASGFAKRLNGGVLSNCYSISTAGAGALIAQTSTASGTVYTGTLHNVYWDNSLVQPVSLSAMTISGSTGALSMKTMKTLDFVAILNENRGTYGTKWGQSSTGYPYFGEDQEYDPDPEIALPEDSTKLTFQTYNANESVTVEDQQITLDVNAVDGFGVAGTFCLPDYTVPEGASVKWSCSQQTPAETGAINESDGEFFLYKEGVLVVTATLHKADGSTEVLASVKVNAVSYEIEDIKVYLTDSQGDTENAAEVVNGTATVQGSESQWIIVKARYEGESIYREVSIKSFSFEFAENEIVHHLTDASVFYFEAPGTAELTVTYNQDPSISETVQITSAYVPVTSVKPVASGTYTVHDRNANSDSSGEFLDLMLSQGVGNVIVEPANASYAANWTLTSSDPEIAEYVDAYLKAVLPKKAGTVTLTATIIDKGPDGTGNTEVTGSSTITIKYFNPVSSVTVDTSTALTVKENEKIDLPITFTGPQSVNGYHVTEAGMTWSFAGDGEVEITRNGNDGVLIYGEDSKEYCVSNDAYQITGIKAGTVTVTGTPIDQTGGAQSITFTVEVTSGTPETPADNDKLVSEGIQNAQNYLSADTQYEYGDEWVVFALTRSGKTLSAETVEHYLGTVAEAYKAPGNAELKPTTIARVMLAVSVLGEDASNFEGLDLVEMLCASDGISAGSNEPIWALIGLDSMDYEVPEDASWDREELIAEVLKYQNESTGAFGLTNNTSASLDMTAMAIQALAPYYSSNAEVKTAVDAALAWLQDQMDRNCDFGSSEATAQVMIALTALQLNPLDEGNGFVKSVARNLITAMDCYAFADGGYKHFLTDEKANSMATQQVLLALEAYRRFAAGEDRLYDLNGNGEVKYSITVATAENGSVTVSKEKAAQGETISITVTPAVGYELDALQVIDASGKAVPVFDNQFVMPASDVTVTATFKQAEDAVKAVEDAIASMKVEKADQKTLEALQEIQSAYDALTEQEKAQVSNAADLEKLWDAFEEALDQYVKEKTDALNDYIEALGKSNYAEEKWSEIEAIQADTIAELAKADTTEAVDKLYADAIAELQNVSYGTSITVYFTLLGDSKHGDNGTVHTLADGNLTTWINKTAYQVDAPATVWDVFKLAVAGKYSYVNSGNYISSINGLSEFDNGPNSGWKYTLNGVYPSLGVEQQELKNGDVIVFHYTDDYTKEDGSTGTEEDAAVQKVEKLIDEIGTVTLDKADEITAARKAYDSLTYAQKQKVSNYAKLTAAETKYAQLKAADDEKKADAVEDLIDAIKEGSTTFEDDVKATQKAYNNLTADQKKLVDNYYKLANYLKELADEEDKEAAEAVEKLIEDLGTITLDSEEDIKAAREAYDKLTDEQKALVENLAVLEAAEERLAELKALADVADIYKTTGDYLENLGTPVPGSVGGEWMVIGLARSDREIKNVDAYYEAVIQYVQENIDENERLHSAKSSENSRMILALTAIGKDVTDVGGHNLLTGLNSMEFIQKQGINGPIWALLAFDSGNYPVPEGDVSREALIQGLLDAQLADGGWALTGTVSDPDITGMALQALAPYYKTNAEVKAAIDEALVTLSEMQAADGSYASIDGTSSESIAQVIVALSALGIDADTDARFIKNGVSALDALCAFYVEGGGFRHIPTGKLDGMATEQGYYALTAYFRMLDDETALYNMTDVIDMGGDVEAEPDETMPAETEPVETEPTPADEGKGSFLWWIIIVVLVAGVVVVLVLNRKKIFANVR